MKIKGIILLIGFLNPMLSFGQRELAMIKDTDGYVYVRAEKDANSEILMTLKEGDFFLCEPSNEDWWRIDTFSVPIGYVHKSRIRMIKDLTEQQQRSLIINTINKLGEYRAEYDSLRLTLSNDARMQLIGAFEDFEETHYSPLLPFLSQLFCKNRDVDLLDRYLRIMIINQMSANEMPAWTLGDCYLCYPDLVIKQIKSFKHEDKEYLWEMLVFGFENVTEQNEDLIENYQELKDRLKE